RAAGALAGHTCCALSCSLSLSLQPRGGPHAVLISSVAGRQKRVVSPKFSYETFQANRRGERITQHRRREFPAALSTAGCMCVCVCACAGEREPEHAAGSLRMVLWQRAPCPGPSPEHSAPIPAPHPGEERGFLLCQLPRAPLGQCGPDSLALGPRVVAPPSFWTWPAGHLASSSHGMSPVLHSSLVVILTLPSAPRGPPERRVLHAAVSGPLVTCPQKSPQGTCCPGSLAGATFLIRASSLRHSSGALRGPPQPLAAVTLLAQPADCPNLPLASPGPGIAAASGWGASRGQAGARGAVSACASRGVILTASVCSSRVFFDFYIWFRIPYAGTFRCITFPGSVSYRMGEASVT
ncbi:LOW QUALITY PROTEIN: uncharacterized protein, partial [Kogia breviceps]|uniref:LOW QUALITY PROTEIN: uncharacterized protein n=1 Tax=Kogia breviceps TaxID=27615 RepID=UPI0034D2C918